MARMLELVIKKLRKLSSWNIMVKKYKLLSMTYQWNLYLINNTVIHIKNLPPDLTEFRSKEYE